MTKPPSTTVSDVQVRPAQTERAFALITLLGAALLLFGALIPWAVEDGEPYYPMTPPLDGSVGDGALILGICLVAACIGIARLVTPVKTLVRRVQALAGAISAAVVVFDWNVLVTMDGATPVTGLYVALFGGIIVTVGAFPLKD